MCLFLPQFAGPCEPLQVIHTRNGKSEYLPDQEADTCLPVLTAPAEVLRALQPPELPVALHLWTPTCIFVDTKAVNCNSRTATHLSWTLMAMLTSATRFWDMTSVGVV